MYHLLLITTFESKSIISHILYIIKPFVFKLYHQYCHESKVGSLILLGKIFVNEIQKITFYMQP